MATPLPKLSELTDREAILVTTGFDCGHQDGYAQGWKDAIESVDRLAG